MPLTIGSAPPATTMQGDTVTWRFASSDATPADATLRVRIAATATTVEVDGVVDGDGWLVTIPAADSKRLGSGLLRWIARATYTSGAVQTVGGGQFTAASLPELGTGASTSSHAARMVALLEAQLERLAGNVIEQHSVGERSATRRKIAEVEASLSKARNRLAMEQNGGRLPPVHLRFPPLIGLTSDTTGGIG